MKIVIFRNRLRAEVNEAAYLEHANAMYEIASRIPGFISAEDFTGEHGERLSVIVFKDEESLAVWREHPEHRVAQARGRAEYYASYTLQVCGLERETSFAS